MSSPGEESLEDLRRQFEAARDAGNWDRAAELSQQITNLELELIVTDSEKVDITEVSDEEGLMEAIRKMPFMPEKGEPLPEYVVRDLYPSPAWDLMKPPTSEYGKVVVEETAGLLKEFMTGGSFILKEKFEESGWSSEDIIYVGKLIHVPTRAQYLAEVYVSFEWRAPADVNVRLMILFREDVEDPEETEEIWNGDLSSEGGQAANEALKGLE